jgi:hypothetical protein
MKNLLDTKKLSIDIVKGFGFHVVHWDSWHVMIACFVFTFD